MLAGKVRMSLNRFCLTPGNCYPLGGWQMLDHSLNEQEFTGRKTSMLEKGIVGYTK